MSSHQVENKDLLARLGPRVSGLPIAPPLPGLYMVGNFFAFVLGSMGVMSSGPPSDYSLKLFLFWVLPCFLLAAYGGVTLYRELWATNWEPALHERGIALLRAKKWLKTFALDEVREIAIRERDLFASQEFCGRQWDVTLRSAADRVTFRLRSLDGQPDDAGVFVDDLRAGLAGVAGRRLRQGEALAGKGWRLTDAAFKAGSLEVPFGDVAGADLFGGGRVAVWRIGEEDPFFTVPAHSTNAMVLHDVLAERLPTHALGLGRLQFEKRSYWLPAALAGFRCYERGLVKHSVLGQREIQFAEVGGITYKARVHKYKGIHLLTSFSLVLHRRQGGEPLRVSLHTRRLGDRDLEGLRDRLEEKLAAESYDRLDPARNALS
jgi:hypothetical protein